MCQKNCTTSFVLLIGLLSFVTNARAATIADIAGDWIDAATGGTAAGWSYFESDAFNGGTETPLTPNVVVGNAGNRGFGGSADFDFRLAAILGDQNSGAEFEIFSDGDRNAPVPGVDVIVHTAGSSSGNYFIARRTITAADLSNGSEATINGSFRNLVPGFDSVSVFVYQNDTQLFAANGTSRLSQADGTFNVQTTAALNDTIDFVVFANADRSADETAIRATINLVPEPSSLALLGLGGLVIARRRR